MIQVILVLHVYTNNMYMYFYVHIYMHILYFHLSDIVISCIIEGSLRLFLILLL